MNGCLIPNTPIAVDFWSIRKINPPPTLFFLSHMHADHTSGLKSSWQHPIYCSEITASLLQRKFSLPPQIIHGLELDTAHTIPLNPDGSEFVTVNLIDANHCPGSVMFLFEGYFGKILYTGDFRYTSDMFIDKPVSFYDNIETLYLDNTYCSASCDFPSREECTKKMIEIIQDHPDHQIKLCIHSLGKEDLLEDLALHFKTWIVVSEERLANLKLLERKDVFSTDPRDGFIHVVERPTVTAKKILNWNKDGATITILASALSYILNRDPFGTLDGVYTVPYSDHSSYPELCEFISQLRPRKIVPIVKTKTKNTDMSMFNKFLDSRPIPMPRQNSSVVHNCVNTQPLNNHTREVLKIRRPIHNRLKRPNSFTKGVVFDSESPISKKLRIDGVENVAMGKGKDKKSSINSCILIEEGDKENISRENSIQGTPCSENESFETCQIDSDDDFQSVTSGNDLHENVVTTQQDVSVGSPNIIPRSDNNAGKTLTCNNSAQLVSLEAGELTSDSHRTQLNSDHINGHCQNNDVSDSFSSRMTSDNLSIDSDSVTAHECKSLPACLNTRRIQTKSPVNLFVSNEEEKDKEIVEGGCKPLNNHHKFISLLQLSAKTFLNDECQVTDFKSRKSPAESVAMMNNEQRNILQLKVDKFLQKYFE